MEERCVRVVEGVGVGKAGVFASVTGRPLSVSAQIPREDRQNVEPRETGVATHKIEGGEGGDENDFIWMPIPEPSRTTIC